MASKRVSHSILDPYIAPLVPGLYRALRIPAWFPPEGIIAVGHLSAIAGAVGFAMCGRFWWGGVVAALGVIGNHLADSVDGTHARATGQCRNGGELLDHFTDPLSFSYWMIGLAVAAGQPWLGYAAVLCIYATAVLTGIKAKMVGEFTLAAFGPTEFKALLAGFGVVMAVVVLLPQGVLPEELGEEEVVGWFLAVLVAVGAVSLLWNLVRTVREVNRHGAAADTQPWDFRRMRK